MEFSLCASERLSFLPNIIFYEPVLLGLDHRGRAIFRMSVNPAKIIHRVELGTTLLGARIQAVNAMAIAGFPAEILIAPVILLPEWRGLYRELSTNWQISVVTPGERGLFAGNCNHDLQFYTECYQYRSLSPAQTVRKPCYL